jgi:hypothetical protein
MKDSREPHLCPLRGLALAWGSSMMEVQEESKLGGKGAADLHASALSTDL